MASYILVDGNNLASRSFHRLKSLKTTTGVPTSAIFGFLRSLKRAKSQLAIPENNIIVCWDAGRPEWKKQLLPTYKAGRKYDDGQHQDEFENYLDQLECIREIIDCSNYRQVRIDRMEADDIIGILCQELDGYKYIYSYDKDLDQLVSNNTFLYRNKLFNEKDIRDVWGCEIESILLFKCIQGDPSDNIKGIRGMGRKRTLEVLPFVNLKSGLISVGRSANERIDRLLLKVEEGAEIVLRNSQLMQVPAECYADSWERREALRQVKSRGNPDEEKFRYLLKELEINDL